MKITSDVLNIFIPLPQSLSAAQVATQLTQLGHECEGFTDPAALYQNFVVAHVIDAQPHPQADRLQVCTVDAGEATPRTIVCGAANARKGLYTVLALPNAVIPATGSVLKAGKVRGVESQGMMCSAEELGLASQSDGILELAATPAGTPLAQVAPYNTMQWHIAPTPDRPDVLGVHGIAAELSALWQVPLRAPAQVYAQLHALLRVDVTHAVALPAAQPLANHSADCTQLTLLQVQGVNNTVASPAGLTQVLHACGMTSKNRLVDITNLFALLFARPLHVYNGAALSGTLHARAAHADEKFTAINGKEYTLTPAMTVIADASSAQAIGGVMGAAASACDAHTSTVWLEAAQFSPASVGNTGRALGIASDSRTRFERGIDPADVWHGVPLWQWAVQALVSLCGGQVVGLHQHGAAGDALPALDVPADLYQRVTGHMLSIDAQIALLQRLDFTVTHSNNALQVRAPSRRRDILVPADVVGELVRLQGIDAIPPQPLPFASPVQHPPQAAREWALRHSAANAGLHEAMTWSFVSATEAEAWIGAEASAQPQLSYPLSADMTHLRPNLLIGLLRATAQNIARGVPRVALFEIGQVWHGTQQRQHMCTVRSNAATAPHWQHTASAPNGFTAKADAERLLQVAGIAPESLTTATDDLPHWLHPYQSGRLFLNPKVTLAYFGLLHPRMAQALNIDAATSVCSIDLTALPAAGGKKRAAWVSNNLQPLWRDFSFVLPQQTSAQTLLRALRKAGAPLLQHIQVFDVYAGKGIVEDHRALGVQVMLQPTVTLTDAQINDYCQTLIAAAQKAGAALRGV